MQDPGWVVEAWGYVGISAVVILGNMGLPIPEETILILAGYLVWEGKLRLPIVLGVGLMSAVLGDNLGYWIGREFGRRAVERYGLTCSAMKSCTSSLPRKGKHNYSVYIALYDSQTNIIQFPYLIDGKGNRFTEPPTELGPGLTSAVIRAGQPLVLNTLDEQISHGAIAFTDDRVDMDSQSWLGVPIKSGDRVIGVFSVQDQRPNLFAESDVRLLSTLASSLGVALENSRLFSEIQQRAAELATFNTVSSALAGELKLDALIELVGEQIRTTFKADIAYVALLDEETNIINFPYIYGEPLEPMQYGEGLTSKIIQSGKPLLIGVAALQIALGVLVILSYVNIVIALLHQANAIVLFVLAIYFIHRFRALDRSRAEVRVTALSSI